MIYNNDDTNNDAVLGDYCFPLRRTPDRRSVKLIIIIIVIIVKTNEAHLGRRAGSPFKQRKTMSRLNVFTSRQDIESQAFPVGAAILPLSTPPLPGLVAQSIKAFGHCDKSNRPTTTTTTTATSATFTVPSPLTNQTLMTNTQPVNI